MGEIVCGGRPGRPRGTLGIYDCHAREEFLRSSDRLLCQAVSDDFPFVMRLLSQSVLGRLELFSQIGKLSRGQHLFRHRK